MDEAGPSTCTVVLNAPWTVVPAHCSDLLANAEYELCARIEHQTRAGAWEITSALVQVVRVETCLVISPPWARAKFQRTMPAVLGEVVP